MPKQLVFGEEARRGLKRGIDKLAEAVATTLARRAVMWRWIRNLARRLSPMTV